MNSRRLMSFDAEGSGQVKEYHNLDRELCNTIAAITDWLSAKRVCDPAKGRARLPGWVPGQTKFQVCLTSALLSQDQRGDNLQTRNVLALITGHLAFDQGIR